MIDLDRILLQKDLMRMFGVNRQTLYLWRKRRRLPGHKLSRIVIFDRDEILKWAKDNNIAIRNCSV